MPSNCGNPGYEPSNLHHRVHTAGNGFSQAKLSMSAVEERCRGEIADMMTGGLESISDLIFHSFEIGGVEFICTPKSDSVLEIDTCSRDETTIKTGLLAGKKIFTPHRDSD